LKRPLSLSWLTPSLTAGQIALRESLLKEAEKFAAMQRSCCGVLLAQPAIPLIHGVGSGVGVAVGVGELVAVGLALGDGEGSGDCA